MRPGTTRRTRSAGLKGLALAALLAGPGTGAAATRLTGIETLEAGPGAVVHLRADGALESPESFTLKDPERLVIDLPGLRSAMPRHRIRVGSAHAERVRVGQHADKVRVVIDAGDADAPFVGHRLLAAPSGLVVALGSGEELDRAVDALVGGTAPPPNAPRQAGTAAPALVVAEPVPEPGEHRIAAAETGAGHPVESAEAAGTVTEAGGEEPADAVDPRRAARDQLVQRQELGATQKLLIKRPDRRRPDRPLTVSVFGRPLTFGGRYTFLTEYQPGRLLDFDYGDLDEDDLDGDGDVTELEDAALGKSETDDRLRLNQSLELDLLFSPTENVSFYIEGRIGWLNQLVSVERTFSEWQFARSETWLYLGNLLKTPLSLQVGRQRFSDEREWWWDANLDSIRLRVDRPDFHAQISVAEELFRVSADEDFIVPEEKDVLRILGHASWEWASRQQVGVFALYQNDRSDPYLVVPNNGCLRPIEGNVIRRFRLNCIDPEREDESDADLTWFGISAEGRWKLDRPGRIYYWLNAAGVLGEETFYDFGGGGPEELHERYVDSADTHDVAGWGIDLGATLQTNLLGRPYLTLGYAYGSGGKAGDEEFQTGFRQTSLQDNNGKFRGVVSFRYYGELFEPELSNLHILTAGLGFRFLRQSSFDFVYHYYRQDVATDYFRDVGPKRDPDGLHRGVGHEWDFILGIEEWGPLELKLVGAIFMGGQTFAPDDGVLSYLGALRLRLSF